MRSLAEVCTYMAREEEEDHRYGRLAVCLGVVSRVCSD